MALRPRSIKFDPDIYEFVATEAAHLGVSTSDFIRAAALARASLNYARRTGAVEAHELYDVAQRLVQNADPHTRPFRPPTEV